MTQRPVALCFLIFLTFARAKIYKRCELALELLHIHKITANEIPVWVCIAKYESVFNTSAVNKGSGDHGLFQISDLYWCSNKGQGGACNKACSSFEDDDISDDVQCIRRIYNEHKRLSGNGFNAWVVYPLYCRGDIETYVEGCFDLNNLSTTSRPSTPVTEGEDEYEFPPLPVLPKYLMPAAIQSSRVQVNTISSTSPQKTETPMILVRKVADKLRAKYSSVTILSDLGYYTPISSTMTTDINESNFANLTSMKHETPNTSPHEVGNSVFREKYDGNTIATKSDTTRKSTPKVLDKQIVKNVTLGNVYKNFKSSISKFKEFDNTLQSEKIVLPSKLFFPINSEEGSSNTERSFQRNKTGRGYIFEKNGKGGFRLTLE